MFKRKRKLLSMLLSNNTGATKKQQLQDGAPIYLPLTHTAVPARGSIVPSFTRATTETGQKWDEAGYLDFTALAGEIVFKGARRVRNLCAANTNDVSTWNTSGVIVGTTPNVVAAPDGTMTAGLLDFGANTSCGKYLVTAVTMPVGATASISVYLRAATAGTIMLEDSSGVAASITANLTTSWQRFNLAATTVAGARNGAPFVRRTNSGQLQQVYVWGGQVEDVTGQADQNASEYVSVGVPADWAGTEGVSNPGPDFTASTGWSTGAGNTITVVDGDIKDYTTVADGPFCGIGFSVVNGTKYVVNTTVASDGTSVAARTHLGTSVGTADIYTHTAGYIFGQTTFEYTATSTGMIYVWFYGVTRVTDKYILIDSLTIKPAAYHGSMVDGVKCYDTDRSGNPISTTGSYPLVGYVPWEARTNKVTYSEDFTNWTDSGAAVTANTHTSPNGQTTADTLTRVAGAGDARFIVVSFTGDAAKAVSVWVKKGTSPSSLIALLDSTAAAYRLWCDLTWSGNTPVTAFTNGSLIEAEEYPNNLWRLKFLTDPVVAANANRLYVYPGRAGSANGQTVIVFGGQGEDAISVGPYIPTTTVAVARNASVLTYTGAGISALAGAPHTIFAEIVPRDITSAMALLIVDDGTTNNRTFLLDSTAVLDKGRLFVASGGATQADLEAGTMVNNIPYRMAGAVATNSACFAGAGSVSAEDTSVTLPAGLTTLRIGLNTAGTSSANCPVRNVRIWNRALSSSELQAITS